VGGVWYYTRNNTATDDNLAIPHTTPRTTPDNEFLSPAYDLLETNIPHSLMNFSDRKFPLGTPLFPRHEVVRQYITGYAEEIQDLISFQTLVLDISPLADNKWEVTVRDLQTNSESKHVFDAVIIASGHYSDPYIPDIPGIREWNRIYPGAISHAKFYRRPEEYKNKKVIIIGNSASGIDLSSQIAEFSQQPLLICEREKQAALTTNTAIAVVNPKTKLVPEITEFLLEDDHYAAVRFADGYVEKDIDHIVFCTGYLYSYPFLSKSIDPPVESPDGSRPCNLFQHVFYRPRPTLSFIGTPQRIVPLPVSEAQSALIARIYSGRLQLPSPQEMKDWEIDWIANHGSGRSYNSMPYPLDAEYINYFHNYSLQAEPKDGLENDGKGKIPPYWGEKEKWVRSMFPKIKAATRLLGGAKQNITTLEELGFDFEATKSQSN
jgi:cation diffusion facilitator CzcD-associated flavoprotein CzcO